MTVELDFDKEKFKKEFGMRVAYRRKQLHLSQEDLRIRMGYKARASICKIENGENDLPQRKVVELAKALDCSEAYLMGWTDNVNYPEDGRNNPVIARFYTETYKEVNRMTKEGIELFTSLSSVDKRNVIQYMKFLAEKENANK